MTPTLYHRDGGVFIPSPLTVSPWNPGHQSGIAVAGLLTHLLAGIPTLAPMTTTRLTIDLIRPTPRIPLPARCEILREGKKVQLVRAALVAGGVDVATATALRMRALPPAADEQPAPAPSHPPPEAGTPHFEESWRGFPLEAVEARLLRGGFMKHAETLVWLRPYYDIVAGETADPLALLATVCDLGNGLCSPYGFDKWRFPNIDIGMHLARRPVGPWFLLDAAFTSGHNGGGMVDLVLSDQHGRIGRAIETLMIDRVGATVTG